MSQKAFVLAAIAAGTAQNLSGEALTTFAVAQVKAGLMDGTCPHKSGKLEEKKAQSYAGGVVGNYFKKEKALNGGVEYKPKTVRGPIVKDERLKELKASIASLKANGSTDMALISRVEAAYAAREIEVKAAKAATKVPSLDETMATLAKLGLAPAVETETDDNDGDDDQVEATDDNHAK